MSWSLSLSPRRHRRQALFPTVWLWMILIGIMPLAVTAQLLPPPAPTGNPVTPSKVNLGKVLFWDEQLSSTRTISCGTCHITAAGGDDPRSLGNPDSIHPGPDGMFGNGDDVVGSPGVPATDDAGFYLLSTHFGLTEQVTNRRTGTMINAGESPTLFWDGRAGDQFLDPISEDVVLDGNAALESQAVGPVLSDVEMAHRERLWSEVITRLEGADPLAVAVAAPSSLLNWIGGRSYPELFEEAFGTTEISPARIGMAIATYERILLSNQAPFDEFLLGADVLTPEEISGRAVFTANSCDRCHALAITSDHQFHYTGVRPPAEDPGRFDVTGDPDDMGRMRTPNLRNIELRGPYMHNGRFDTLVDVVEFYNRGGDFDAPNKDNRVRELFLSQVEKDNLVAFLSRPLTDPRVAAELPPFDRPTLYTESSRVPSIEGMGVAGSGDLVPRAIALEPPLLGNPSFTVAVSRALGGANAVLVFGTSDPGLTLPASGELVFENIVLEGSGPGNGFGSVNIALPSGASEAGSEWFGRWYVEDTGGGGTVAVSRVMRFKLFTSLSASALFLDGFESGNTSAWSADTN